ncbi:MAG: YkvA family protein [Myxococcota bacterium]
MAANGKRDLVRDAGFRPDQVTQDDLQRLLERQREVGERVQQVPGRLRKLRNQITLLFEMIKAYAKREYTNVPWWAIAMGVAAVAYFLTPADLIPDFIPIVGYVDDAVVVGLAVKAIQEELRRYTEAMGYDAAQYFD